MKTWTGAPYLVLVNKEVLAVIPPANDVVNRPRVFDPLFAWHEDEASRGAGDWSNLYILRLTPAMGNIVKTVKNVYFMV